MLGQVWPITLAWAALVCKIHFPCSPQHVASSNRSPLSRSHCTHLTLAPSTPPLRSRVSYSYYIGSKSSHSFPLSPRWYYSPSSPIASASTPYGTPNSGVSLSARLYTLSCCRGGIPSSFLNWLEPWLEAYVSAA